MTKLSKSPMGVARHALALGKAHLPLYAHRCSPKTYTQPQLFVCLVLKTIFAMDYRGIVALLHDFDALSSYLGLSRVPHYTTLQKASRRLLEYHKPENFFAASSAVFADASADLNLQPWTRPAWPWAGAAPTMSDGAKPENLEKGGSFTAVMRSWKPVSIAKVISSWPLSLAAGRALTPIVLCRFWMQP